MKMKTGKIFTLAAVLAVLALGLTAFINNNLLNKINGDKGFAVVELFTSEGCSSCPPADELVAKIQKESQGKPVYILAYHVDYWDRLGWKDPFSSAEYSKRQNEYARYLHLKSVYTPQVVVNGKTEFVGSEDAALRSAIKTNLQKPPTAQIILNVLTLNKNEAVIKYNSEGTGGGSVLLLALLQKSAQKKVTRGENAGHNLSHVQIVRKLQRVILAGNSGTTNFTLPNDFDANSWEIIALLQNASTGAIMGAARTQFSSDLTLP